MNKGSKEGAEEEVLLTINLNKKLNLSLWDTLEIPCINHFAIRIISKQYGRINEAKISPKADIFIAYGEISEIELKNKNYLLNEVDLLTYNLKPVLLSGIPVKRCDSSKYQIFKMSPSTFYKPFGSNILAAGSSIYCQKDVELIKNKELLVAWNVDEEFFLKYYNANLGINLRSITNPVQKELLQKIKTFANQSISQIILNDKKISDFIFFGIGNFNEPYTAHWIFLNNKLEKNFIIPFNITTGSGRSKNVYTIVLKPKE